MFLEKPDLRRDTHIHSHKWRAQNGMPSFRVDLGVKTKRKKEKKKNKSFQELTLTHQFVKSNL